MSRTIEIPDIAQREETDSELAKYTIAKLEEIEKVKKANKKLQRIANKNAIENAILKQTMCENSLLINENALLKSTIKEAREYIEENKVDLSWFMATDKDLKLEGISNVVSTFRLLEILDKGEPNE